MFERSLEEFRRYRDKCFKEQGGFSASDAELGLKISQLQWLIKRAQILNVLVLDCARKKKTHSPFDELEIISESFYYFVGRLEELLKYSESFPNLPRCGATKVRHQLLQHPEKEKSRAKFMPMFTSGDYDGGPLIKSYSGPEGSFTDKGLFYNAKELDEKIVNILTSKQ